MSFFTQDPKTIKLLKEYFPKPTQEEKDVPSLTAVVDSSGETSSTSSEIERTSSGNLQGD